MRWVWISKTEVWKRKVIKVERVKTRKRKKEIGKNVLVQERISEKRFKIGTSQRNQKTSEFGRNHKSEKKVRNLEKSERNQKRKSEKKVRNLEKCPKRNKKSKYMVAVLFDGSCAQLWEKGEKLILVKSWKWFSSCFGFSFVPVHGSFSCLGRSRWKFVNKYRVCKLYSLRIVEWPHLNSWA